MEYFQLCHEPYNFLVNYIFIFEALSLYHQGTMVLKSICDLLYVGNDPSKWLLTTYIYIYVEA